LSSSGRGDEGPVRGRACLGGAYDLRQVVSEHRKVSFLYVAKERGEFTMRPRRRGRQSPDPEEERELFREREMSRDRGRQVQNPDVEREAQWRISRTFWP
jgi:hypothetical protein